MAKKTVTIVLSLFALPHFVGAISASELQTQITNLETRAAVIDGHLRTLEQGGTAPKSKADLLAELAALRTDVGIIRTQTAQPQGTASGAQNGNNPLFSNGPANPSLSVSYRNTDTPPAGQGIAFPPGGTQPPADGQKAGASMPPVGDGKTVTSDKTKAGNQPAVGTFVTKQLDDGKSGAPPVGGGATFDSRSGNGESGATGEDTSNLSFGGFLDRISGMISSLIPFIIGLAVFLIIWKLLSYIGSAGDEEKRTEAKRFIVWGVIGVFCMLSLWGFVNLLLNSFTLQFTIRPGDIPTVPTVNQIQR